MPVLCGMGDAYNKGTAYQVRGFQSNEERFMNDLRTVENDHDIDIPTLVIGAALGALFVFVTVLAIVMWG